MCHMHFHPFEVTLLRVTPTPLMIDPSFSHVLRKPCNLSTAHLQKETCPSLASLLDVEVPQTYDSTETEWFFWANLWTSTPSCLRLATGGLAGAACGALIAGPWRGVRVPGNELEPSFPGKNNHANGLSPQADSQPKAFWKILRGCGCGRGPLFGEVGHSARHSSCLSSCLVLGLDVFILVVQLPNSERSTVSTFNCICMPCTMWIRDAATCAAYLLPFIGVILKRKARMNF